MADHIEGLDNFSISPEDREKFASLTGIFDDPVDPYGDLPVMSPDELKDGDMIMMLGRGCYKCIPISWLIRYLDGGAYSHSAMVSIIDGQPMVWDHSPDKPDDPMELHPVSYERGVRDHWWAHVYRFVKDGQPIGSDRFPRAPLVSVLESHRGDVYDIQALVIAGVIAILAKQPEDPFVRGIVRQALDFIAVVLKYLIDHEDLRKGMLTCTSVTGLTFWQALNKMEHDYALLVDIERDRAHIHNLNDQDWQATIQRIRDQLARLWEDLPEQLQHYEQLCQQNTKWVEVGGSQLPVNLVSPSDLEFSATFERVAKLPIPSSK